jgi:Cu(I)/Ag(I) efflux system membrane protein CusA/SilA
MLAIYSRVLDSALLHRRLVIAGACVLLLSAFVVAFGVPAKSMWRRVGLGAVPDHLPGFGKEFMPALEEDSLLFMPVLLPSTSLTEVKRIMAWQDRVIKETPEVASVGGKLGRADSATDPAPIEMIETTIMLKPRNEWRPGVTKDTIVSELRDKLMQVPGYVPAFLQPIENRLLMLSTGIRAQVGVKILGNDLNALNEKAREIEQIVRNVRGATGVAASRLQGKPYVEIIPDRTAMAQYGVTLENVMRVVEAGLGGVQAGTTIQGRERWGIQVRFEKSRRDDIEEVASLPVPTMDGKQIPLGQLARVQRTLGPSEIQSENGRLRTFVQTNVSGRDLGGFVDEIRARIAKDVRLEPGMTVEYSGQYEQQIRAGRTLAFVLPVAVLIIFLLLVMTFRSVKEAAHVILAVPFALTGGVFLQAILGYNFSVAVWVGYIALFGTAIQTGVVMVVYLEETLAKRRADVQAIGREWTHTDFLGAVKDGALLRLRPKLMTVATVVASLMPIMWSSRAGAEVMKPLAAPVIGGMISSLLHILVVTPVIFAWLHEKEEATPKVP